jgi:hypothetical protein
MPDAMRDAGIAPFRFGGRSIRSVGTMPRRASSSATTRRCCWTRVRKEDGAIPSLDCPVCEGSGYVQGDDGETLICARCDGTGVVFVDDTDAARSDVRD